LRERGRHFGVSVWDATDFVKVLDLAVAILVKVLKRIGFLATAEEGPAAERPVVIGVTAWADLIRAASAQGPGQVRGMRQGEDRQLGGGDIQAMVEQIELAAGPAAETDRTQPGQLGVHLGIYLADSNHGGVVAAAGGDGGGQVDLRRSDFVSAGFRQGGVRALG